MIYKQKLSVSVLAALALNMLVPTAVAAGMCFVSALDTVAGLGTQVSITGCAPGSSETVTMNGPSGQYTQEVTLDAAGNAVTLIPSKYAVTAGTYQVTAAGQTSVFKVIADRADDAHSKLTVSPESIRAGGNDSTTVTAILRDRYDNPVAGRPMALVSSRSTDDVSAASAQTDDNGRFLWRVSAAQGGTAVLIPYDIISGKQIKLRSELTVIGGNPYQANLGLGGDDGFDLIPTSYAQATTADLASSTIDHFELSLPQNAMQVKASELFSLNVRAMRGSELVRGYIGTLTVVATDQDAELPKKGEDPQAPNAGRIDFRSVDQGVRSVPLAFVLRTAGPQTLRVYDKLDPSISGEITINVLRGSATETDTIVILDPKDRSAIKSSTVLLQGRAPSLVNLKVKGGVQVIDAESDSEGVFRVQVPLNPADKEVTLFVTSENGTYESQPVHLIVDNDAPTIGTISFNPADGKTGDPAIISVKSEAGLKSVTASIEGKSTKLTESGAGLYLGTIVAPAAPLVYDVTVVATDSVDNATTMLVKWNVKPKLMEKVQGVTAESQPLQVTLKWNAIESWPIKEYKIYIARKAEPKNFIYSISTQQPVVSAVIKDLPLGDTYLFSLTGISEDGTESPEKSAPVEGSPIGMRLTAKGNRASILLEWSKLQNTNINQYILEYGDDPSSLTERRIIGGQAVSFMIRDLLDGVTYHFNLTPVAVTGKVLSELAATVSGTPNGNGFAPGTGEQIPDDILDGLHSGASIHNPPVQIDDVPTTPGSGISSMMVVAALVITGLLALLWRKHRKEYKMAQEFLRLMQDRYQA